jgi:hypothetical protein
LRRADSGCRSPTTTSRPAIVNRTYGRPSMARAPLALEGRPDLTSGWVPCPRDQ